MLNRWAVVGGGLLLAAVCAVGPSTASAEPKCVRKVAGGLGNATIIVKCEEPPKSGGSSANPAPTAETKSLLQLQMEQCEAAAEEQWRLTEVRDMCSYVVADGAATVVNVAATSREAALALKVPSPALTVGPDPARNEWNMIPVNFPVWFESSAPARVTDSVTSQGITIELVAVRESVSVVTGDGTTLTCRTLPARPEFTGNALPTSPGCGHTYRTKGVRTITATARWVVTWSAVGQSGSVTTTSSSSVVLDVGELRTVLVRPPA